MGIAQGVNKITVVKKQTGLGVAASGSGGQILRRESSGNKADRDSYGNNEIAAHQQSTGVTLGLKKITSDLKGVLSPGTYAAIMASVLRKAFAQTTAITGASITIAGTLGAYTLTRGAGSYLTDGVKIGDVWRLTAGSFNAANINKNLLVTNVTATVITVATLNGSAMVAEGPVASATLSMPGKKSLAPLTGHTSEYWTVEDWYADVSQSEKYTDVVFGGVDVSLEATGNASVTISGAGRDRALSASQVLTTPTAATTSNPLAAVSGLLIVNGSVVANVSGASLKIDGKAESMGAVLGSLITPDIQRGVISVSGQFMAFFQDATLSAVYDSGASINFICVLADSSLAEADFVSFNVPAITLTGDAADDGLKGIKRTYPFTAEINAAGGAALATDQTIISIQDSLAP